MRRLSRFHRPYSKPSLVLTGELRNKVDKIWDTFWSGGVSNPLSVIEQMTYLLFARRLDELHTAKEAEANLLKKPIQEPIFTEDNQHLRWSRFKDLEPEEMFKLFRDEVFPFIKTLGKDPDPKKDSNTKPKPGNGTEANEDSPEDDKPEEEASPFRKAMKDAVFIIPKPSVLASVVDQLSGIAMDDRDTKGDLYEYMLSKIASAGQNGQFRTPRHIIRMMVDIMEPTPTDVIGDPACGTCGFLVVAGEYLREHPDHRKLFHNAEQRDYFSTQMFHGADFDSTMLRIGAMNLMLHGIEHPQLKGDDSLSQDADSVRDRYTLILANPPFKGSLNYDDAAKDILKVTKTKKTELLFLALMLKQLKPGGRCACIVPDGVLFGSSNAHLAVRKAIVDEHRLEAIIDMPSGVFKPYAGVSTAVLIFTRTDSGGTDNVMFYHMQADGFSLDDKREPVEANDIGDVLVQWQRWKSVRDQFADPKSKIKEFRDRKARAFAVPVQEIRDNKYDLSINRYKEIEYEEVEYDSPLEILDQLEALEAEITSDLKELRGMLG